MQISMGLVSDLLDLIGASSEIYGFSTVGQ